MTMADMDLTNEHPDFQATAETRTISRDLFEGRRAVKANAETYLYKEPRESDDNYEIRVKRAVLDNWIPKIIAARQGVIFRKQPERKLPPAIDAYRPDVDRNGTSDEVFFERCAHESQVDGIHWVVVDMPRLPQGGFRSRAEEKQSAHRPFFQSVPANNVIDWQVAADGELLWAVVKQSRIKDRETPGTPVESVEQFKVWFRDHWELYEQIEGDFTRVDEGVNSSGVVPLVPFFGIQRNDYSGWPVAEKLLDHILLIYNKASDLDRSERIAAHPVPYLIAPKKLEKLDLSNGVWIDSKDAAGIQIEMGILEPSGVAFDSIRQSIAGLIKTIYAIALAQAQKDSAQVQSADGQKEDRKGFNASLRSASRLCEMSEQKCWEIWALWAGVSGEIEVRYNDDFDDAAIEESMIARLFDLSGGRPVITRKTLLETLKRGEIIDPELDVDAELSELENEDAAQTQALARSLSPVAVTLPPEPDAQ